jgi:hypothetical protein
MPRPKRADPVSRPVDGAGPETHWVNLSPDRHYVEVSAKGDYYGVDHYSGLGYEVEIYRGDSGPRPRGRFRAGDGAELQRAGCVLMSCPREDYEARNMEAQSGLDPMEKLVNRDPLKAFGVGSDGYSTVSYDGKWE